MAKKPEGWTAPYPGPTEAEVYRFDGPWPGTVGLGVAVPTPEVAVAKVARKTAPARKTPVKKAAAQKATKKQK